MFTKTTWLVAAGAGYVLGARAGRERYDEIVQQARRLWRDPRVQETVATAQDTVKEQAAAAAHSVGAGSSEDSTPPAKPSAVPPANHHG